MSSDRRTSARTRRHRAALRALATATVALAAAGFAGGCGSGDADAPEEEPGGRIVLVSPGAEQDTDWTVATKEAFEAAVTSEDRRGAIVDASSADDLGAVFDQAAHDADLVVAGEATFAEASVAAAERTGVPQLVWGEPSLQQPGKVGVVDVDGAAAGYAAGVAAAHASGRKHVGVVVCDDGAATTSVVWNEMASGFVAGARSVAGTEIEYVRVPRGENSVRRARGAASRLMTDGAQVLFGLCGIGGEGVAQAVAQGSGVRLLIAVNGIKGREGLDSTVMAAFEWNLDPVFAQAITDVEAGRFGRRPYRLDLGNGGVVFHRTGTMPFNAYDAALEAVKTARLGEAGAPIAGSAAELAALMP